MEYIYKYFDYKSKITIKSAKPADINTSIDILAIILYLYPKINPSHIVVSNPHENKAIIVGDNINLKGSVKVFIEKS